MNPRALHQAYLAWKAGNYLPRHVGEQIFSLAFKSFLPRERKRVKVRHNG